MRVETPPGTDAPAPRAVVVVVVLPRASTPADDREADAAGVDAVTDGELTYGPPDHVVRVTAPASPHDIGVVCAALHRGARVVVCDAERVGEAAGVVRAVRTYEALLRAAGTLPR